MQDTETMSDAGRTRQGWLETRLVDMVAHGEADSSTLQSLCSKPPARTHTAAAFKSPYSVSSLCSERVRGLCK